MNRSEASQDWERYARHLEDAWYKEYQRQTVAYQQLQIELTQLLRLILPICSTLMRAMFMKFGKR